MNKSEHTRQKFTLYVVTHKGFILPCIIIMTCFILVFAIVIPQFQHFLFVRNQVASGNSSLAVLQQNFQQITSLNDEQLNSQFQIVSRALPVEENVVSILDTISAAAGKANVSLQDYSFEGGSLTQNSSQSNVVIDLTINNNDINVIQQFIHELKTSLPLSSVTSVKLGGESSTLTVNFYIKPYLKPSFDENSPLQVLSQQDKETIDMLASWDKSQ